MGGRLLLGACTGMAGDLGKIVLLGTPWDFHAGDGAMLRHVAAGTPAAFQGMAERGYLPKNWVQSVFAALNADRAARKFTDFAALDPNAAKARLFVAVEDWLNDGTDLPAGLARQCITDWYGANAPMHKMWRIGGRVIDPSVMTNDVLVVAARRDRLVPPQSSLALKLAAPHIETLEPDLGHIGMMAGQNARLNVWTPVADWLLR
jgi:polyhydroxyalkanoate synthase